MGEPNAAPAPVAPAPVAPVTPVAPAPVAPTIPAGLSKFQDASGSMNIPNLVKSHEALQSSLGLPVNSHAYVNTDGSVDVTRMGTDYLALEQQRSTQPIAPQTPQIPSVNAPDPNDGIDAIIRKTGLSKDQIAREWTATGELTEGMYAKFAKQNVAKPLVNALVGQAMETHKQQQAALLSSAVSSLGGQEQYNNLMAWAATLPEAEKNQYNALLESPDSHAMAIRDLGARYTQANGSPEGAIVTGSAPLPQGVTVPQSIADIAALKNDPRYDSKSKTHDPRYVKQVQQAILQYGTANQSGSRPDR